MGGESVQLYQLRYGKDNRKFLLPFSTKARDFSLIQDVNTGFDARSASYSVGTGAFFLEGKVPRLHLAVPHHFDMRL